MKSKNSHNLGVEGEKMAKKHLLEKGFVILQENWRFKKYEVDIIAKNNDLLIIVEVKTRSSAMFGEPEVFVTKQKQRFLIAAANEYLVSNNIDLECRFDIISVLQLNNTFSVKHLEGAFYPSLK
jgi:putative endonuclease